MRNLLLSILCLITCLSYSQHTQLWGLTNAGGDYGSGTIFKTDESGENHSIQSNLFSYAGGIPFNSNLIQISDGTLYGMTQVGGLNNLGVIFQFNPITNTYTKKLDFNGSNNGKYPLASLVQASDGMLYGMTCYGGVNDFGVLFQFNPITNTYTKKLDFDGVSKGSLPNGSLIQASDGMLYGMTNKGGVNNLGVIFQYDPVTNVFTKKLDFDGVSNGSFPNGSLIQASDGYLYGITNKGGVNNIGVVFQYNILTDIFLKKIDFDGVNKGSTPSGSLTQASNGKLYGNTTIGGINNAGVIFEFDPVSNIFNKQLDFDGTVNGKTPCGSLIQSTNGSLYGTTYYGGVNNFGILFQFDPATNNFTKNLDFDDFENGKYPLGSLLLCTDGSLYGMTSRGGKHNLGVLLAYNPSNNTYAKKFDFGAAINGAGPFGSLMLASDGKLYGLTTKGGTNNFGVLFQYDPSNNLFTKKIDFTGTANGSIPYGSLIQATNGKLYGTTRGGGLNNSGVLFEYDLSTNTLINKYNFGNSPSDGHGPVGSLLEALDGKLYGMCYGGGVEDDGILFQYDPVSNVFSQKIDFYVNTTGGFPTGSLMQASDGKIYGLTAEFDANGDGVLFQYDPTTNNYTVKHYGSQLDGNWPAGSLIEASDGMLYGMTEHGGINNFGVLFQFNPITNIYTKKFEFDGTTYGKLPYGDLIQSASGNLYGMTSSGGAYDFGVLFEFNPITNVFTKKLDFNNLNGSYPKGSLIEIPVNITVNAVTTYNCLNTGINIIYTTSVAFDENNTFIAQLSNETGLFISPLNIGTYSSNTSGIINATIPSNIATGSGYRIRVVSTNPVITSNDNGTDITIDSLPNIICANNLTLGTDAGLCTTIVTYNVSTLNSVDLITYSFTGATTASGIGSGSGSEFNLGETIVSNTATNSCGSTICTFTITIIDNIYPSIVAPENISSCETTNIDLGLPLTNDNCTVTNISNNAPTTFTLGTNIVTWTVTDVGGNLAYDIQTVTINAPPTISIIQNNLNLSCSLAGLNYEWYLDGILLNNATEQTITASANGTYTVKIIDVNSCTTTSAAVTVTTLGIKNDLVKNTLFAYPNPVKDKLFVIINSNSNILEISNVLGKIIDKQIVQDNQTELSIDVTSLSSGVYFIKNGTEIAKFIKD